MVDVCLLFPPATDPRSPHLAIPSLAAALRAAGPSVKVRDLDVEALDVLLTSGRLEGARWACERRLGSEGGDRHDRLRWLLGRAERIVERAPGALADLRDPVRFFDPDVHHEARAAISAGLELVSRATGRVDYGISPPRFDVSGVDATSLDALVEVTSDPAAGVFGDLFDDALADVAASDPTVVGISILNRQQIIPGLTLARRLRAAGRFVVIGGTLYAKFVPELLARPEFFEVFCDAVVPYEGETALIELTARLQASGDLSGVPNLCRLDHHGRPVIGPVHLEDVAALPTPDFDGLPLGSYLAPAPVLPLLMGKGCSYNKCKFCDIPFINRISSLPYRVRGPEQVAADVVALHRRHGARHFELTDETLSPELLLRLADELDGHRDIHPRFVGYARFEPGFTSATCERLHELGMRKLFFGLESGSQETINHMRKGFKVDTARRVVRNCADAGIAVHLFSIIGFPEESEAQATETLTFLADQVEVLAHPAHTLDVHPFGLDLRTDYGDDPDRYGIEVDTRTLDSQDFPVSIRRFRRTRGLSDEDVERLIGDFTAELRDRYRGVRLFPDQQWPGFEEYAVLYGDHYEHRPFPARLTLPPAGDPTPVTLAWPPSVRFEPVPTDGPGPATWTVSGVAGEAVVAETVLQVLARPPAAAPVDELLEDLASTVVHQPDDHDHLLAELRAAIDRLVGSRVLWLRFPDGQDDP